MTTEKIQFFMSDLAYKLGVGEIKEIHVAEQNGVKVLRIECEKIETSEYKTVHARSTRKPSKNKPQKTQIKTESKSVAEKLMSGAKEFLFNPERNKGKREMFGDSGFGKGKSFNGPDFGDEEFVKHI
jgi:hypothetical protein